ncbi:GtrA-like protein [Clostridium tepidiprofundi DSM 19306]|uniref:GtrA-like protein n=1 Tax=Clostridium tepidiprofundi DSM 19306 TaxID=1121338 RepID=A0A151ASP4_9CLOT|nr:GtrA family protein [Clostridium tepidiprofundi]KYH30671.1 GtrA-like protein [Clostridium tepidiprofundi DSM 19306]
MIKLLKTILGKYSSFIKFALVGVTNTVISLTIYWLLLKINVNYLVSSTLAYIAGIFNGYILSSKYVFNKTKNILNAVKFFSTYLSSLLINLCLLYIMVNTFKIDKAIAQLPVVIINMVYNYIINKVWTFK